MPTGFAPWCCAHRFNMSHFMNIKIAHKHCDEAQLMPQWSRGQATHKAYATSNKQPDLPSDNTSSKRHTAVQHTCLEASFAHCLSYGCMMHQLDSPGITASCLCASSSRRSAARARSTYKRPCASSKDRNVQQLSPGFCNTILHNQPCRV